METIVFTDTEKLASKYQTTKGVVQSLIDRNLLCRTDGEFLILDTANYKEELAQNSTWEAYKEILIDFFAGMGIVPCSMLSLFIIGGDDVIPMPRIQNPIEFDELLQSDFLYCFNDFPLTDLNADNALCNVGRLPLENGKLNTSIVEDLQSYFNLTGIMLDSGIDVDSVLMTSTQSWLPASNEMVNGLPIESPYPVANATNDRMYVSPQLDLEDRNVTNYYKQNLGHADLLMFNLHGADYHGYSSFYGEGAEGHNTPEAFNIEMLRYSNARIFNTVACFGARFIGYERNDSMLLSAMYGGGVMLYSGSCTSALGRSGQFHVAAQDILIPTGMSESFMKLYTLYLFDGESAGEAFLRAKCDYFNTCRSLDGDEEAMATVLMFNLYGLPTLHVNQKDVVTDERRGMKRVLPIRKSTRSFKVLYKKYNGIENGLLENVQMKVDRNLMMIRKTIENKLYSYWGLNPSNVYQIDQVLENNLPKGYRFEYKMEGAFFNQRTWAYTDNIGNIKDVIHTK